MKIAKPLLFIGGAGIVAYLLMQKANAVKQLQWQFAKIALDKKNTGLQKIALLVTIRVTNPTRTTVAFDSFTANLSVKGNLLTTMQANRSTTPVSLTPGTTDVTMMAWVDTFGLLKTIPSVIRQIIGGAFNELLDITGTLYAGGLTFPLQQQIAFSFGNNAAVGKARVSLEFDNNNEAAEYFQRSNIYVTAKGGGKSNLGYSLNGIGSVKKKFFQPHGLFLM